MDESLILTNIKARTGPADANGCLPWIGAVSSTGLCVLSLTTDKQRKFIVQRLLWDINHPDELFDNLHRVGWSCGNKRCVNVEHLQKVTRKKDFDSAAVWSRMQKHGERLANGCLVAKTAYEKVVLRGVIMGIHKAAFMLHNNLAVRPPNRSEDGVCMVLRHLCNETRCFEPTHLAHGTQRENCYEDKIVNGTLRRGARHPNATITEELAREIKKSRPITERGQVGHETPKQRAHRFRVSESIVRDIDVGRSWAHLSSGAASTARFRQRASRARAKARVWTSDMYLVAFQRLQRKLVITTSSTHVDSPCHIWTGSKTEGYGTIGVHGKEMMAHVLACEIKLGGPLEKGQVVRHLCGVKACCAPDHLQPGSCMENAVDSIRHGTHATAKLTEEIVRDIRITRGNDGLMQVQRAKKYNIGIMTLFRIEKGLTWKHVM